MDPTDRELVRRARSGDPGAFDALVSRHGPGLLRLAAGMLGQAADAQDVVQETLLGAFKGLARFDGRSAVRTWLVGILVRQASLHRRRGRRWPQPLDEASPPPTPLRGEGTLAAADARLDLAAMLAALSEEHRQVLLLREIEGLSYDDIATLLGIARGTVESRIFRARQALRDRVFESDQATPGPAADADRDR